MFAPRTTNGQPHLPPELAAHSLAASAAASLAPPPHRRLRKSDNDLQQHQRSRSRSPTAASDSSTSSSSSSSKAASWRSGGKRRTFSMRDLLHRASDHSSTSALLAASLFPSTPSSSSSSGGSGDENAASGADLGWTSSSPDASPPQLRRRDKLKAFLRASGEEHSHRRRSEDGEEGEGVERKHHHRHRRHREEDSRLEVDDDEDRHHHRHRHLRKHLVPQRCPTESSLCQARAPLITIDDASPLSSPDAHATRSYRPQRPPLGIDDGDHQSGPTPHLAFAGPLAEGAAAAAVMSVANATTTRPHARISGAADDHHHQHQQQPPRTHAALARSESAPALPPVTPAHSSLAAIERAFPGSAASAQHEHHPLPPLSEAADEGLQGAGEKRRNRMARVREKRGADKSASHAVLYFPDRAGDESVIREFDRSHWHHEHLHHLHQQHNQEPSAPVKEAKAVAYNPFEAAHFPPPRLYGSSRLSMALPPGSPAPPPADVDHSRMTREEGSTKTDEEERLPDFPFPVSPVDTWSLIRSVQQLYYDGHTVINQDTIIGRKLYNFRDLSEATRNARHGVKLASQRIFRSACLSRGDVDHVDVVKSLIYLKDFVKIKTMIDFRNKDERMSDPLDAVVDAVYPRIKKGALVEPSSCRRYNIPLMNKSFKIMGLFLPSKWGTKMNMVKAVVYGSEKTPTEIFAEEAMNPMGLLGLNKLMLVYGKEEIAQVLRICANSSNHPIMYHCSSGKDRTGLITALILLCCGVDAQDIIANYHESEIFLSPVMDRITAENQAKGLNAGFDGTPPEVMEQTIDYIFEKWGSITGYFSYCGFGNRDQMKLVQHLGHHLRK